MGLVGRELDISEPYFFVGVPPQGLVARHPVGLAGRPVVKRSMRPHVVVGGHDLLNGLLGQGQ